MSERYAIYTLRCADGRIGLHPVASKTNRALVVMAKESADRKACGPHDVLTAIVETSDWAVLDPEVPDPQTAARDEVTAGAQRFACPKCQAGTGMPCENLTARRSRMAVPTNWPHAERVALWSAESAT